MRLALDLWPAAVMLMEADARIRERNAAGAALLARGPILLLEAGRLRFRRQEDGAAFRAASERAATRGSAEYFCLHSRQGSPTIGLTLIPRPADGPGWQLVIACELIDHVPPDPVPLSRMMGVTPAEARVAVALASGLNIAAIAERDALSVHTVRDHVKHVLAKTGTSSQAQLVRLVVKLSQIVAMPHVTP